MNLTLNDGWVGYLTKQPYLIVFPRLLLYTRPPVNQQNGMTSLLLHVISRGIFLDYHPIQRPVHYDTVIL